MNRLPKVWWLTLGMAVVATALSWVALGVLPSAEHQPSVPWWALIVCFAATEVFVVLLRLKKGAHSVSLSEIPLVVGLAFTSVGGLLFARVVGAGAVVAFHRGQRGVKLAFNLVHFMLEASVALVVYRLVLGSGEPGRSSRLGRRVLRDAVARCDRRVHDQRSDLAARRRLGLGRAAGVGTRRSGCGGGEHEPRPGGRARPRAGRSGGLAALVVAAHPPRRVPRPTRRSATATPASSVCTASRAASGARTTSIQCRRRFSLTPAAQSTRQPQAS